MKKKIFILLTLFMLVISSIGISLNAEASGSDYTKFTSITPSSGKLVSKYTDKELSPYKKKTNNRRFSGWRIAYINNRVKCNFVSETVMSVYNTGTTPITYKLNKVDSTIYKTSISCTGSIGYKVTGDIKKFKNSLDTSLKIENQESTTIEVKTTENLEIEIDPGTKTVMYLQGTGYLTNGYARRYSFWICEQKGCFEFFEITDVYPKFVKVAV